MLFKYKIYNNEEDPVEYQEKINVSHLSYLVRTIR